MLLSKLRQKCAKVVGLIVRCALAEVKDNKFWSLAVSEQMQLVHASPAARPQLSKQLEEAVMVVAAR